MKRVYFRFVIRDGEVVHQKDITHRILSGEGWRCMVRVWQGEPNPHDDEDVDDPEPDGTLCYIAAEFGFDIYKWDDVVKVVKDEDV